MSYFRASIGPSINPCKVQLWRYAIHGWGNARITLGRRVEGKQHERGTARANSAQGFIGLDLDKGLTSTVLKK